MISTEPTDKPPGSLAPISPSGPYTYDWQISTIGPLHITLSDPQVIGDLSRQGAVLYAFVGPVGLLTYLLMRYAFAQAWTNVLTNRFAAVA